MPFLAMGAAAGWERLPERGRDWEGRQGKLSWKVLAAASLALCVPYGIERASATLGDRVSSGLAAARYLRAMRPQPRLLALEQTWAYGEHLWLGNDVEIREIEYNKPFRPGAIRRDAAGADVVGGYAQHFDRRSLEELAALGFRPLVSFSGGKSYECSLFGRGAFAPARRAPAGGASERDSPAPAIPQPSTTPHAPGTP
jgi:hypothetical protein